jgi:hypothetical protein
MISAFGITASIARTWLVVMPYFKQCGPPEFSETFPDAARHLA